MSETDNPVKVMDAQNSQQGEQQQSHEQNQNTDQSTQKRNRQQKMNAYAPKRGPIMDLKPILNKQVSVKIASGRQVQGTLTGYDQLMNVVIENAEVTTPEYISEGEAQVEKLDKVVIIGRLIVAFEPLDGFEIINTKGEHFDFVI